MSCKQKTLNNSITFKGRGLHTGLNVIMTVNPAPENTGIVFTRVDLEGSPNVPALCDFVTDTARGTVVEKAGVRVSTIEHILSALWSNGVDNALIEIDAPETPIMDGSAKEYSKAILSVGLAEQDEDVKFYKVTEKIVYEIEENGVEIILYPDDKFDVTVHIDYNSKVLGNQYATFRDGDSFNDNVAACRTFVFLHELEPLLKLDLIKGGDLENAIIVVENKLPDSELERLCVVFNKQDVKVTGGYLNNLQLRYPNEPARHKLLDLLGDLALLGVRIKGRLVATRPGHHANTQVAKLLKKKMRKDGVKPLIKYNVNAVPVLDINQIKALLPHRPPFLLVDKVIHIDSESIAGIKNVTMNEPFFVGHFPSEPVMPGVLIVEAMAQCGGLLTLHSIPDPENYSTYFMKIDAVKFKQKVVPGDTLQFELKLAGPIRRGIVLMEAKAFVGEKLVTEATLMAQIAKI